MALEIPTTISPFPPGISKNHKSLTGLLSSNSHIPLSHIKQAHGKAIRYGLSLDSYTAGSLVKLYSLPQHDCFHIALKVFDQVPNPHVFLWNSIIRACLGNGKLDKAILFYSHMLVIGSFPNKYTYPFLFKACALGRRVVEGKQVHAHVLKLGLGNDKYIRSSGIQMYASCGLIADAGPMVDKKMDLDAVCWNAMIDGYLRCGELETARMLFDEMPCRNVGSWNVMITGYARSGLIEVSREMFDAMPQRDDISWSAMIDGYAQCGFPKEALIIFNMMQNAGISPKRFVLSSVLAACANARALEQGRWVHGYIQRNSIPLDATLGTSLVDMYAKCGCLDLSKEVFEKLHNKEVSTWNAMITGFSIHGRAEEAFKLFQRMQVEGFQPDAITFIGLMNACAHVGLVDEGRKYFASMQTDFNLQPSIEHYGCMVDLLGRAGYLSDAENMILSMPFKPNAAVWGALLGACRIHNHVVLAEKIAEILLELEPENSGRYTLLSNIYAKAEKWDDVARIRKLMKDRGTKTIPGVSSIESEGTVHEFVVGDFSHPRIKDIHLCLEEILDKLRLEGYVPKTGEVLFNIDDEQKETTLHYHSEKLAVAFGLLNSKPGMLIRIMKNLRVCRDCHDVMKLISRAYDREIIVSDRTRFHNFKGGKCSCNDFW